MDIKKIETMHYLEFDVSLLFCTFAAIYSLIIKTFFQGLTEDELRAIRHCMPEFNNTKTAYPSFSIPFSYIYNDI